MKCYLCGKKTFQSIVALTTAWFLTLSTGVAQESVSLAWDPNPVEENVAGYIVYYGTTPGNYSASVDAGNATNVTVSGLASSTTYYFAATAYNQLLSESSLSQEITHTTSVPSTNNPPSITLNSQYSFEKETSEELAGVQIEDPDGGSEIMQLVMNTTRGNIQFDTTVPGGVTANQVVNNGSGNVVVSATLNAINNTLAAANGLVYTGHPNLVGDDALDVSVTDSGNQGAFPPRSDNAIAQISVTGNAIDDWLNQHFDAADLSNPGNEDTVYGDHADPEADGMDNLMEYSLGFSPDEREALQDAVQSGLATGTGNEKYATLTFRRRKNQSLIVYVPEVSSDQQTWNAGPTHLQETSVTDLNPEFEVVTYQDLTAVTPSAPRYLRLTVVKPN